MPESIQNSDFQQIRDALQIPREFAPEVLAEAEAAAKRNLLDGNFHDAQDVPFVTIDPPGSMDLDQAFFAARKGEGYAVKYAIDDIGFFVDRDSKLEQAASERGVTLYSPDLRTPVYPAILSESVASLLPDVSRLAIVFDFTLDARAEVKSCSFTRSIIRSRAKLAYHDVSDHLDAERKISGSGTMNGHDWSGSLTLLEEIGRRRQQLEIERGAINLRIPAQQVERWSTALYGYRLAFEESSAVEEWNAQISLMTGMVAAEMMISHGVGLLRALDPPRHERLLMLSLTAKALGVRWNDEMDYADFVRSLDPKNPLHAVVLQQAAKINGGARYVAFEGAMPKHAIHAAIAAPYAHVTAPLRRLADRYVLDLLVDLAEGKEPSEELIERLYKLPQIMSEADHLSHQLESAIVDFAEARLMQDRIGETFSATVIGLRREGAIVQITDPPIRTLLPVAAFAPDFGGDLQIELSEDASALKIANYQVSLGQPVSLKLTTVSLSEKNLSFSLI